MKKKNYLDLYYEWIKNGIPMSNGLCDRVPAHDLQYFFPTDEDRDALEAKGLCSVYWASGKREDESNFECGRHFNPLRQNIVLFLAAMNNEL